jgi:aspartate-semialdehyde dehydrogenase
MMTTLVGLVGWRGMVGSVLMERMTAERDFDLIEPLFFSTSNAGGAAPAQAKNEKSLQNAFDIEQLKRCDIIITAQGGDYTTGSTPSCAPRAGPATGSTRLRRCAWRMTPSSSWTPSTVRSSTRRSPTAARTGSAATAPSAAC